MKLLEYEVYQDGKLIDTVFYNETDAGEVKKSLINHDGYPSDIKVVRKVKKRIKRFRENTEFVDYLGEE